MSVIQHEVQDFPTIASMVAITYQPQDNDKFFCLETGVMYDYSPTATDTADGKTIIALTNFPGRFKGVKTGDKIYSTHSSPIGDGTSKVFTITHNLNNLHPIITFYEGNQVVYADYTIVDSNSIQVSTTSAPTVNQYTVCVFG